MCEAVGSEPIAEEIPIELEELTVQSQEAIEMYNLFPSKYSDMSGSYLGVDISIFPQIFSLYEIPKDNWLLYLALINTIMEVSIEEINRKIQQKAKNKGAASSGKKN